MFLIFLDFSDEKGRSLHSSAERDSIPWNALLTGAGSKIYQI